MARLQHNRNGVAEDWPTPDLKLYYLRQIFQGLLYHKYNQIQQPGIKSAKTPSATIWHMGSMYTESKIPLKIE